MRQLILFRHAKAVPADEADDDFQRALADTGRIDAPRVAEALVQQHAAPEMVLVSPARRAMETWELAQPFFPNASVRVLRSLYHCAADTLMTEAERTGAPSVMVVAHNPCVHELASRLAHRNTPLDAQVRAKFPPAGAAMFERKDDASAWRLIAFVRPQALT